ncbi:MAG: nucleoside 2-deoxyribosyltransferase [Sedimentisphaerales bacterium]|nr:nucleoside 2-deoxyribosyltransferase [Sedimentisphaerales bacterium]
MKIYCAGPLFNPKEREEMSLIAEALETEGFSVFLPHRDGLELAQILPVLREQGLSTEEASLLLNQAIFAVDVYQILDSDGVVVNVNGRVPDEGAMVEAGIAWSHEKIVVIFKSDTRSLVEGSCNPLVMGLANFGYVSDYHLVPDAFREKSKEAARSNSIDKPSPFNSTLQHGEQICKLLQARKSVVEISDYLLSFFGRDICLNTNDLTENYSQANTQH